MQYSQCSGMSSYQNGQVFNRVMSIQDVNNLGSDHSWTATVAAPAGNDMQQSICSATSPVVRLLLAAAFPSMARYMLITLAKIIMQGTTICVNAYV